jgi:hypothetical protein
VEVIRYLLWLCPALEAAGYGCLLCVCEACKLRAKAQVLAAQQVWLTELHSLLLACSAYLSAKALMNQITASSS